MTRVVANDANVRYHPLKLTLKEPQAAQSVLPHLQPSLIKNSKF
jgi:hypothetical protein